MHYGCLLSVCESCLFWDPWLIFVGGTIGEKPSWLKNLNLNVFYDQKDVANIPAWEDSFLVTHPSDRNSTYVDCMNRGLSQRLLTKVQRRRERLKESKRRQTQRRGSRRGICATSLFLSLCRCIIIPVSLPVPALLVSVCLFPSLLACKNLHLLS